MAQSVLSEGPTLIQLEHLPPQVALLLAQGLPEGATLDLSTYATDADVAAATAAAAQAAAAGDTQVAATAAAATAQVAAAVARAYTKPAGGIPAGDLDMTSVAAAPTLAGTYGPGGSAGNAARADVEANTTAIASLTGQVAASGGGIAAVLPTDISGTSATATVTLPAGTYELDGTTVEFTSNTTTGKAITATLTPTSGSFGRVYTSQLSAASTVTAPSTAVTSSAATATGAAYQWLNAGSSASTVASVLKTAGLLVVAADAQVRVTWTSSNVGITAVSGSVLSFTRRM